MYQQTLCDPHQVIFEHGSNPWADEDVKDVMMFKLREYFDEYMFEVPLSMSPDQTYRTLLKSFDIRDMRFSSNVFTSDNKRISKERAHLVLVFQWRRLTTSQDSPKQFYKEHLSVNKDVEPQLDSQTSITDVNFTHQVDGTLLNTLALTLA
jgi:hypothetical protein